MSTSGPIQLRGIRNITVSGRIATGTTTLAKRIAEALGWKLYEGGQFFAEVHEKIHATEEDVQSRADSYDLAYEEHIAKMLKENEHIIIQSHLAGFDAQGMTDVFKIVTLCEDADGKDKTEVRIDRLVNRKHISVQAAKEEVKIREAGNLEKWRRLYAGNDPHWVYWDKKYYDLVVNTYTMNQHESAAYVLEVLKKFED